MHNRWAAGLVLILTGALAAKEPLAECGSYFTNAAEEAFLHARHSARRATARFSAADVATLREARANQDVGEIAVIGSGNGVVGLRNPFDLVGTTLTFTRDGNSYKLGNATASFDTGASLGGTRLTLGDDETQRIALPFAFPFYGATYNQAFVNSNGTLTFTQGDLDYSGAFGHFAAGPPAIAALFADLNPLASTSGVRLFRDAGRVVITWDAVPLSGESAQTGGQTFQIRIYPNGNIDLTYTSSTLSLSRAVTGLNPGNLQPVTLVDLTTTTGTFATGVAESFSSSTLPEIDMQAAAQRFYQTHDDAYDYLVFYNAMDIKAGSGVVAYELTTRSSGQGYGDTSLDEGAQYGSKRQLQAVLNLGPTSQYPNDPFGIVPTRGTIGDSPVTIIAHEAGHLWLALVSVPSPTNSAFPPMLGAGLAHWAFPFNSDASVLEGNRIVDQGAGQAPRFRTTATVQQYSALDQYLMGLRAPQDVPPTFAVLNSGLTNSRAPQTGVTFNGTRLDITVDDVIKAAGRRTPDATVAQRNFRMGFVMIVDENASISAGTPAAAAITQIDAYRTAFETFFNRATDGRATVTTTLRKNASLSLAPAGGVALGRDAVATVTLDRPTVNNLTFVIQTPQSIVSAPQTIVIPSGSTQASFNLTGNRIGVEELKLIPNDPAYFQPAARVQVNQPSALRVAIVSGDKQRAIDGTLPDPIVVSVVDQNNVPYSNQPLEVKAIGGGSPQIPSAKPGPLTTDNFGRATLGWTTTSGSFNTLSISIPGVSSSTGTASALGLPAALPNGIVNAASYTQSLAPGGFATIFGGSLAAGKSGSATNTPLPTVLGGTQVTVNGTVASITYASDSQINFIVPANISPGTARVQVSNSIGISAAFPMQVVPTAPGIFYNTATGAGAILLANTALTTQDRPATTGDFLEVYTTGLGSAPVATATIAGNDAPVSYAGSTSYPGLQQVNIRVPVGIPSGTQTLVLRVNGIQTNPVTIQVR